MDNRSRSPAPRSKANSEVGDSIPDVGSDQIQASQALAMDDRDGRVQAAFAKFIQEDLRDLLDEPICLKLQVGSDLCACLVVERSEGPSATVAPAAPELEAVGATMNRRGSFVFSAGVSLQTAGVKMELEDAIWDTGASKTLVSHVTDELLDLVIQQPHLASLKSTTGIGGKLHVLEVRGNVELDLHGLTRSLTSCAFHLTQKDFMDLLAKIALAELNGVGIWKQGAARPLPGLITEAGERLQPVAFPTEPLHCTLLGKDLLSAELAAVVFDNHACFFKLGPCMSTLAPWLNFRAQWPHGLSDAMHTLTVLGLAQDEGFFMSGPRC
mmetsp:Transcript_6659/g.11645  ORF Transcript_6659/g.11645 Transcript_6659/m.11645 type:complete len:326 (+) Transcript_6659:79-1056(+)